MMKEELIGSKYNGGDVLTEEGFSTLEMLIAFAVITLSITAVILVSFGNQSVAIDTDIANEALYLAELELEEAFATSSASAADFISLSSTTIPAVSGEIFDRNLTVVDISPCVKRVTSEVAWQTGLRNLSTALTSIFISQEISEALSGDCITEESNTPWKNPATFGSEDLVPGGNQGTDIDVVTLDGQRIAFLTSKTGAGPKSDLWAFDVTDASTPIPLDDVDVDLGPGVGLNSLDVAGEYVYAVGNNPDEQLQIFRFNPLPFPGNFSFVATSTLNGVDPGGSFPEGQSVYFLNDRLYVGTHETAGPEFHVFDVSNPANPNHLGSLELNHNVHEIVVRGDYAYIASSGNGCELIVVNISDPGNPSVMTNPCPSTVSPGDPNIFDAAGSHDGMSLFLSGNKLYLGRKTSGADHDLYVLNISDLNNIISLGSQDLGFNPSSAVEAIVVIGNLAFLGTSDVNEEFQVWNIGEPTNIFRCSFFNFPATIAGLDFDGNLVFAGVRSNDALHVIFDDAP